MATEPATIFNHDIVMMYDMCNRFIIELYKSQSSPVSGMIEPDVIRMKSYTTALNNLHEWVQGQPLLDLPETHPREFPLESVPEPKNVESESVNMLVRLVEALRTEMVNSQSARYSSTLILHDSKRFDDIVTKINAFIDTYVATSTPLDLPESSPGEPISGSGFHGV